MSRRCDPFSEPEIAALRDLLARIDRQDDLIGGWTSKMEARLTGFTLYVRFAKKVESALDTVDVATEFEAAGQKLYLIVDRILGQIEAAQAEVSV